MGTIILPRRTRRSGIVGKFPEISAPKDPAAKLQMKRNGIYAERNQFSRKVEPRNRNRARKSLGPVSRVIRPKVPELITTPTWRDALSKRVPPRVAVTNNETGVVVASPLQLKQLVSRPVTLSRLFVSQVCIVPIIVTNFTSNVYFPLSLAMKRHV